MTHEDHAAEIDAPSARSLSDTATVGRGIPRHLSEVCRCLEVDRAVFFVYRPGTDSLHRVHEWAACDLLPLDSQFERLGERDIPWLAGRLLEHEATGIPNTTALDGEASSEHELLWNAGIGSLLAVPVSWDTDLIGSLWFASRESRDRWDDSAFCLGEVAAEMFAHALERDRTEEALRSERDRAQMYLDVAQVMLLAVNRDGKVALVNRRGCAVLGWREEEILGRNWFDTCVPADARDEQRTRFESIVTGKAAPPEQLVTRVRTKDGLERTIAWNHALMRGADRTVTGVLSSGEDVTEQRAREMEVARLAQAVEQAAETILVTDTDGLIQYANPALERSTGYTREEVLGRKPSIFKSGEQDAVFYKDLWDTLQRGETWRGHFVNRRKDGTLFDEEAAISPVRDDRRAIVNYVAVKRDVTQQIEMERRLRQTHKLEAVTTLAGGIAHDFNDILAQIMGYAELVRTRLPKDGPGQSSLDSIMAAAQRARHLTEQVLMFDSLSELEQRDVRPDEVVREVVSVLESSMPESVTIQTELAENAGLVHADPRQLTQVLTNLCTNAFHAMGEKGGTITVSASAVRVDRSVASRHPRLREGGDYVLISVADNGSGIDPGLKHRIFDPFFTTRPGKGTGLGLATVYGHVTALQGDIGVQSEKGVGTQFDVYLPRSGEAAQDRAERPRAADAAGQGEHVLFVDDEEATLRTVAMLLECRGFRVTAIEDPVRALALFREDPAAFDLVLTDQTMPQMTGIQLALELMGVRPEVPVVLTTGFSEAASRDYALALGLREFIRKPFMGKELSELLRRVLDEDPRRAATA